MVYLIAQTIKIKLKKSYNIIKLSLFYQNCNFKRIYIYIKNFELSLLLI